MTGKEKLNEDRKAAAIAAGDVFVDVTPFYVQDLRIGDQDLSLHDDFVYCFTSKERVIERGFSPPEGSSRDTLITCAGDLSVKDAGSDKRQMTGLYEWGWSRKSKSLGGVKKTGSIATAGYFIVLDIDSILNKYKKWFMTNLLFKLRDNIYPLPSGLFRKEIANFASLREGDKEHFCYANFSMTCNYRVNVAQWVSTQEYIKYYFPKRFPALDEDLEEEILSDNPLPFNEFLQTLASYKFCIAPNGVGIDTDRLWECIFMNVVPIAQNNYGNRIFSKIWPMILVDRYEFSDIPKLTMKFEKKHGENIQYNHDLLLRKNLPELMSRIEYECKRLNE